MKFILPIQRFLALAALGGFMFSTEARAKNGATDPIPGTSKGAVKSGGGGGGAGGGSKVVLPPIPSTPVQPLVTGSLTMTAGTYNGSTPVCTGTYRIDPYYPTLSLITVDLSISSVSTPDGSPLFVSVTGAGGTLYPFLGGSFLVNSGAGTGTTQIYCTPGTTITGVTIVDLNGTVVATGK